MLPNKKLKNSNLLVSGCSYTDSQFWIKRGKGPCWPDFLTEKLNMNLINVAQGGAGNEYIYSSILDTLVVNKNIKFVIVMWSEFQRTDFERLYDSRTKRKWTTLHYPRYFGNEWGNVVTDILLEHGIGYPSTITKKSLRFFYTFQEMMKSMKIPFLQVSGCCPLSDHGEEYRQLHAIKEIIDSPYLNKIEEKTFIGWPLFKEIGGYCMEDILDKSSNNRMIGDDHPNEKGHKEMSEFLYMWMKKHDHI
jgi:hypothetical protein